MVNNGNHGRRSKGTLADDGDDVPMILLHPIESNVKHENLRLDYRIRDRIFVLFWMLATFFAFILVFLVLHRFAFPSNSIVSSSKPKLLLISYDGLRWDYLHHINAPNFRWLISNGVHASHGLKNTFITITAPNHYGIVTGLYEDSHKIIANTFFDPVINETFDYFNQKTKTDPRFFRGTPLWNINDANGGVTGCVMWTGCDVPIQGHNIKYCTDSKVSTHFKILELFIVCEY